MNIRRIIIKITPACGLLMVSLLLVLSLAACQSGPKTYSSNKEAIASMKGA